MSGGALTEVEVGALSLAPLTALLDQDGRGMVAEGEERARALLADRTVWHVNSTSRGGGGEERRGEGGEAGHVGTFLAGGGW